MNVNIQNLTKSIETMKKSQIEESQLSARKTDTRIMALIGTASDDCDGQIKTCKKELRAEIQKQRLQIEKQEARFQSITDTLRNKLGDTTKEPDVPTMEKSPSIPVTINQEQLSRIDRNVQNLQQQIENHLTSITMMHSERNEQPDKEQMAFTSTQTDPPVVNSLSSYSAPRQPKTPITNIGPKDPVREVPLYVWMDSNGNNIKPDKFWRDSTEYNTTYRISDIHKELDKNKNTKIGCILIGCGVNDIEQKNGREVGEEMIATVERIRREHPTTKIVLGEITPYNERDAEVITCNGVLRNRIQGDMIQLVKMDHLRDESWSNFNADKKHIKETSTAFFAGAYIAALRRAYNLPPKNERRKHEELRRRSTDQPIQQRRSGFDNATQLMQNIQSKPFHAGRTPNTSIGDRLRRIANTSPQVRSKHDLIAELSGMLECVQTW